MNYAPYVVHHSLCDIGDRLCIIRLSSYTMQYADALCTIQLDDASYTIHYAPWTIHHASDTTIFSDRTTDYTLCTVDYCVFVCVVRQCGGKTWSNGCVALPDRLQMKSLQLFEFQISYIMRCHIRRSRVSADFPEQYSMCAMLAISAQNFAVFSLATTHMLCTIRADLVKCWFSSVVRGSTTERFLY